MRIAHVVAGEVVARFVGDLLAGEGDGEAVDEVEDDHGEAHEDGDAVEVELEVHHGVGDLVFAGPEATGVGGEGGMLLALAEGVGSLRDAVGVDPVDGSTFVVRLAVAVAVVVVAMAVTAATAKQT